MVSTSSALPASQTALSAGPLTYPIISTPNPLLKIIRWLTYIIDGVRDVTHIAPADANGQIVQEPAVEVQLHAIGNIMQA